MSSDEVYSSSIVVSALDERGVILMVQEKKSNSTIYIYPHNYRSCKG